MRFVTDNGLELRTATTARDFGIGRELFVEYATAIEIDLRFQGFDEELKILDKQYARPTGCLILCFKDTVAVGCIAVRRLDEGVAELKRMFVQPGHRQLGIGSSLLACALAEARDLGYACIRLDTLASMKRAQDIYRAAGFYDIPPYRYNPLPDAVFMELQLA